MSDKPISVTVSSGIAISAKSTSTTPGDHVGVFNLAADGGANNAGLNVVSANTAFTACEVSGHETGHGTVKISHVNPGPDPTSDANAAAISIDLQAGKAAGTAAQGIFLKSTTGGTSGKIINRSIPPERRSLRCYQTDRCCFARLPRRPPEPALG
jgi:hypothetical protein